MRRDHDPREPERDRADLDRGGRGGVTHSRPLDTVDPRDALTRDLDLPRGTVRERVRLGKRLYELRGSEVRALAALGTFRAVPEVDFRKETHRSNETRNPDLVSLRRQGLIRTTPYVVGRKRSSVVTLTDRGRELLECNRHRRDNEPAQMFYAGVAKPRELSHDVRLYQAYLHAAERLTARGFQLRRVVLEEELKREYQQFLQHENRGRPDARGRPNRGAEEIQNWAHTHQLPVIDGHVHFPDVRIEYEERDGRRAVEDLEVTTPHYRGAHAAGKARAGFKRYRAIGARLGGGSGRSRGGRGLDPRLAEEVLK